MAADKRKALPSEPVKKPVKGAVNSDKDEPDGGSQGATTSIQVDRSIAGAMAIGPGARAEGTVQIEQYVAQQVVISVGTDAGAFASRPGTAARSFPSPIGINRWVPAVDNLEWTLMVIHHEHLPYIGSKFTLQIGQKVIVGCKEELLGGALDVKGVSLRHAQLTATKPGVRLAAIGRALILVNGKRVAKKTLLDGDIVSIGPIHFMVRRLPLEWQPANHNRIVGISYAVAELLATIEAIAASRIPVLLQGESGVGKDVIAREIHDRSNRSGSFISCACAALPELIAASELFGWRQGAFVGAIRDGVGLLESAQHGTLFLDEIDCLPDNAQVALMHAIAFGEFRSLGDDQMKPLDVRIVASSTRNLRQATDDGLFRRGLYDLLAHYVVAVPSLRERREDIPGLIAHAVAKSRNVVEAHLSVTFSHKMVLLFLLCDWPGNLRHLFGTVTRALFTSYAYGPEAAFQMMRSTLVP